MMNKFKDKISENLFGIKLSEAKTNLTCVSCKNKVIKFRDELSKKEYKISGLCQKCQDKIWGGE